jgi:hypothetical protein
MTSPPLAGNVVMAFWMSVQSFPLTVIAAKVDWVDKKKILLRIKIADLVIAFITTSSL